MKELEIVAPTTSSDEERPYGEERIDYQLYNENAKITHDMEEPADLGHVKLPLLLEADVNEQK